MTLSRFGSHESVCKPYTVRTVVHSGRGREGAGPGPGGGGRLEQLRRSVAKVLGEFSVREHVFYGAIFLSMTIIVMFCFLLVNRTQSNTSSFLPYQGNLGKRSIMIGLSIYFPSILRPHLYSPGGSIQWKSSSNRYKVT